MWLRVLLSKKHFKAGVLFEVIIERYVLVSQSDHRLWSSKRLRLPLGIFA